MIWQKLRGYLPFLAGLVLAALLVAMVSGCGGGSSNSSSGAVNNASGQLSAQAVLRTITCDTTAEIQDALKNAQPGDRIVIKSGTYTGSTSTSGNSNGFFYSGVNGTSANHIVVESESSSSPAVLQGTGTGSKYVLYITGDYWEIKNLKITNAQKGILLDNANRCSLSGCEIYNVGQEALHFRDGSSNNVAENMNIHDTGKSDEEYGEGFYVGSDKGKWSTYGEKCDNNVLRNSTIGPNVTAEHADIKEGTTGTIIEGCTLNGTGISGANYADSFIDVKGNNAIIRNNTARRNNNSVIVDAFQLHQQVDGWGLNNSFTGNTVYLDGTSQYVVNAASGTSATASNNTRIPTGNMYNGNVSGGGGSTPTPTPANTPTPTPTPANTPTPTPTSANTPTPTPTGTSGGAITVQYQCNDDGSPNTRIKAGLKIINNGTGNIDIASIKVRYYYTIDGEQSQSFYVDAVTGVSSGNCVGSFVKLPSARTGADYYLELSFKSGSGSIAPGGSIAVKTRWNKSDFSNFDQTNDYSFDSSKSSYANWTKTTGYVNGTRVWGTEP